MTASPDNANIFAAGAVLWRRSAKDSDDIEIALIHRPRYDDWSLPKGKLERSETAVMAAIREVAEETGATCRLGRHLDRVTYPVPGHRRRKRVDYWAAEATGGTFEPNREVDMLRWLPIEDATDELSYRMDRRVIRSFRRAPADTHTMIMVRHGRAGRSSRYRGDDTLRPLDTLGRKQARALVPNLAAFGPTHVHSADRTRCVQTVDPLAETLGVKIKLEPSLSEESFLADRKAALVRARKIATKKGIRVVCSQGKVIPPLLQEWADEDGITLPAARNRKGSMWVLSLVADRLVAVDHIDSPLPPVH